MRIARVGLGFLLMSSAPISQQYVISTYAGGAPPPTPVAARSAAIGIPTGLATDATGNVYFSSSDSCVFKMDTGGNLTRVAGTSRPGYSGDGGPAINAQISASSGLAVDSNGALYIGDASSQRVRVVSPAGIITTVAGGGADELGDGGQATSAKLGTPAGVAVGSSGNLYIVDADKSRIRKVTAGVITTVAGNGTRGYSGDGGPAANAQLNLSVQYAIQSGVALDPAGNLYVADSLNYRVRKVSPAGVITTVAGNGTNGYAGDGGPASSATIGVPSGLAVDGAGNLYIAFQNHVVRKISTEGVITTVAGIGTIGYSGDGGPATSAAIWSPTGIAVDSAGTLYIADSLNHFVRKVSKTGVISSIAGNGFLSYSGDGGAATDAQLFVPGGLAVDGNHNLYIADTFNDRVRKVTPVGVITTVVGNNNGAYSGDGGLATSAQVNKPSGVAVDSLGNLYVADTQNSRIRKISPTGIITTVVGGGTGTVGDGGLATNASFRPTSVAVDSAGNLYIADPDHYRVHKVSAGIITAVAGNGTSGMSGDGGPATDAQLYLPYNVAVDSMGNVYVGDGLRVRKISQMGVITTVAGVNNGFTGDPGDGGPAISAQLRIVVAIAVDGKGQIFITDPSRVRKVDSAGIITTIAGNGTPGYSGDGGVATDAQLATNITGGLAIDQTGNVYVTDSDASYVSGAGNSAVRLLRPVTVSTIVNAASNISGPISPGELIVIYGAGLGPAQLVQYHIGSSGLVDCQLAGTTVQINGTCSPIIYTSSAQVAAIVPYSVSGSTAEATVTYQGQATAAISVPIAQSAIGIFSLDSTGKGQAACINQGGSINTASTPAKVGDVISCFATGEGQTTPIGADGKPGAVPFPQPNLPVSVTIGGQTVKPQYAGAAPGEVAGLMQINVQIPAGIQTGNAVPVVVQVGSVSSQPGITIAVK